MDEAKEDLEAAILQAKKSCISIQQKAWDNEKLTLPPGEDIHVKRFLYVITLARNVQFFNGYRATDAPKSKTFTRVFMEQRYSRTKRGAPSYVRKKDCLPKVNITNNNDGVINKIEFTETVDDSCLLDLIDNDTEHCKILTKRLSQKKTNWEHQQCVDMQISDGFVQKGAICRMGEHLYGFDGIRDLSLKAATDIDRFFGREPNSDLLYQSPYHFLRDYVKGYSQGFFQSSLSKSAHDLSEWRQHLNHSSRISNAELTHSETSRRRSTNSEFTSDSVSEDLKRKPESRFEYVTAPERKRSLNWSSHSLPLHHEKFLSDSQEEWKYCYNLTDTSTSYNHSKPSDANSCRNISTSEKYHQNSEASLNNSNTYDTEFRTSSSFDYNPHFVRNLSEDTTSSGRQPSTESQCRSDEYVRKSEISIPQMDNPVITTNTDHYLLHHKVMANTSTGEVHEKAKSKDVQNDQYEQYGNDPYKYELQYVVKSQASETNRTLNSDYSTISTVQQKDGVDTLKGNCYGNENGGEMSVEETIRPRHSSDSEATLVSDEMNVLIRANEMEETHVNDHVKSVPTHQFWDQEDMSWKSYNDVDSLLHDARSTNAVLQKRFQMYDEVCPPKTNNRHEIIYDPIAEDTEHIYDDVADTELHHAHAAIVLSEPVQRPLAVTPPIYDEVPEARYDMGDYNSADTKILRISPEYDNDERIYEEIEEISPASIGSQYETKEANMYIDDIVKDSKDIETLKAIDMNSNMENSVIQDMRDEGQQKQTPETGKFIPKSERTSLETSDRTVRATLIQIGQESDDDINVGKVNRELGKEHRQIRVVDEHHDASSTFRSSQETSSQVFQIPTRADIPSSSAPMKDHNLNKYEYDSENELPREPFGKETALATVAIRRMSRSNHWSADDDVRGNDHNNGFYHKQSKSFDGIVTEDVEIKTSTSHQLSSIKHNSSDDPELSYKPVDDEHVVDNVGQHLKQNRITNKQLDIARKTSASSTTSENVEEILWPRRELDHIQLDKATSERSKNILLTVAPSPTFRKGYVLEMAKKFEQNLDHKESTYPVKKRYNPNTTSYGMVNNRNESITSKNQQSPEHTKVITKGSVQESIRVFEMNKSNRNEASHPGTSTECPNGNVRKERERMVSIGTAESVNLDEVELPNWKSSRSSIYSGSVMR